MSLSILEIKVVADDVVATAILDRLLHHCYPFFIQGKSYRLNEMMEKKKEQWKT
ncbi:MAG TPA: ATP-binding protein [Syntrophorhabdaceae bacterium]|nr:ATP-binding protein [Syntrophorhabdaceae bacterium]